MTTRLWVLESHAEVLNGIVPVELSTHLGQILTGEIENDGLIGKLRKDMVLGRIRVFGHGTGNHRFSTPFVRINNHPMYSNGVVFSPYSSVDVEYHIVVKTIDERTALDRIEIVRSVGKSKGTELDFMASVFATYFHASMVKKGSENDPKHPEHAREHRFVLYEAPKERKMQLSYNVF